jgi:hypothetical protein
MERSVKDWGGIIAAFIAVIVVNGMANGVPLGGQTTGEISAKYPTLFTPAGFTFGIWGLIYTLLACFVIYQALPAQRNNQRIAAISALFIANCAANAAWIFVWHYDLLWLSLVLMVCLLVTLMMIYQELDAAGPPASKSEWLFVRAPFSLYVGWITVATIANISVLQTAMGWNDALLVELDWTYLKLALAGAIGATVIVRKHDIVYVLVIAWAAYGVASKQIATPEIVGAATTLSVLAVLLALSSAVRR